MIKINAIDENGKEKVYDVILTYYSEEFKKYYIVYTDSAYENNELRIFINYYNPESVEQSVQKIENKEEYNKIKIEVNKILLTIKNENDKL